MGALPCFIAAVVLTLLAFVLARLRQRLGRSSGPVEEEGPVQTLAETMIGRADPKDAPAPRPAGPDLSGLELLEEFRPNREG